MVACHSLFVFFLFLLYAFGIFSFPKKIMFFSLSNRAFSKTYPQFSVFGCILFPFYLSAVFSFFFSTPSAPRFRAGGAAPTTPPPLIILSKNIPAKKSCSPRPSGREMRLKILDCLQIMVRKLEPKFAKLWQDNFQMNSS